MDYSIGIFYLSFSFCHSLYFVWLTGCRSSLVYLIAMAVFFTLIKLLGLNNLYLRHIFIHTLQMGVYGGHWYAFLWYGRP